jgi:hypothetical protein
VAVWPQTHSVYPIFALASQRWLAQDDLYAPSQYDVYRYSPLVAAGFAPLGLLPLGLGGIVWRALSVTAFLAALAWWGQRMRQDKAAPVEGASARPSCTALLFWLCLPLSIDNVNNGQSNMLLIALLIAGTLACGSRRWNLAAFCVALACLFKVYPIAVGLLLALVYPRRFAGRFAFVLVLGLGLPFFLQRPGYVLEQYAGWLDHMQRDVRQGDIWEQWYRDLRLLCRVWGTPLSATTYAMVQLASAGCIAALCFAGRAAGWPERKLAPLLLGLACCWMTAFGPATETTTYVILAPMTTWFLIDAWLQRRPSFLRWFYPALYVLFVLSRVAGWLPEGRKFGMVAQPATALLFFGGLLGVAIWQLRESWLAVTDPKASPYEAQAA